MTMKFDVMHDYDTYFARYEEAYTKQLEIEDEAKMDAEQNLKKALDAAISEKEAGQGKLAGKFITMTYDTCRDNIKALVESIKHPSKAIQGDYRQPMEDLLSIYDGREDELENLLVLVGLSRTIDFTISGLNTYSQISLIIGHNIKSEATVEDFIKYEAEKGTEMRWFKDNLSKGIEQRARSSYKIAYVTDRMHKEGYTGLPWSKQQEQALGIKVLEMIVVGSNLWTETEKITDKGKKVKSLEMSEWFLKTWTTNENRMLANAVKHPPCIIPPKPWTGPYDGGYYGACKLNTSIIRLHYGQSNKFIKDYKRKLMAIEMPTVYGALNAMQETPFVINKFILKTLKAIVSSGGELGGVVRMEPYDTLPKLPDTATEEELKEHKKKLVGIYKMEEARKSKALRMLMEMQVAEKFSEYPQIYFPWNIDYRGRCYPIPTALSPQSDDIGKSLLLFAEGSALKTSKDWEWMAIHGANLAGHDKAPFADRIKWVVDNTTNIVASADDPLGYKWWYEESKGDYPMEFLAFCNEWKNLQEYLKVKQDCVGFVSNLPLAFDGTCSGLQHFSAILRDEVGGHAVNLTKTDRVQDIYSLVAEKVNKVLLEDAKMGTDDTIKTNKQGEPVLTTQGQVQPKYGTKVLSQNWISFNRIKFGQDGITRKVCKRSVMTLAYGSKQYGFKQNLLTDIIHPYVLDHPDDVVFVNPNQAATYMAKLIWDAVGATVIKAVEGMSWLQDVAALISSGGNVVTWTTPNGLPVQQNYMKEEVVVKHLRFNKARIRIYTTQEKDTEEIDNNAQRNGIAPNFIHSMDACHLQRVVMAEKTAGNNNFMMIHDSFGTDCAHAGDLYKTIRAQFIGLYKDQNHLQNFMEQVAYLIPDDEEVKPIPSFGKLSLDDVAESDFCFA